jgi:site-specific recombinase XerC
VFVCRHLRSCPKSPFLSEITAADGGLDVGRLTAGEVGRFVLGECATRSVGSAKNVVMALRSLLRFLYLEGVIAGDLAGSIPAVAPQPRSLPRALDPRLVARPLASCDRRTGTGRRDFAVLTVLARVGLRAGEVAAIELGTSIGSRVTCSCAAREDAGTGCRYRSMSGRLWPTTCNAAAPGLPARGCSCACTRQPGDYQAAG